MKARTGCWTCKARRVQCDGRRPICRQCVGTGRTCQGYGMRLSWPRSDNKKRAMTTGSTSETSVVVANVREKLFFVNATFADVELYRHLSQRSQSLSALRSFPGCDLWSHNHPGANHLTLLHYFHHSAYLSLVTFDQNPLPIRDVLLRMTLSQDTAPGPLFYVLLAFSSLCRDGLQQQALELKVAALTALSASSQEGPLTPLDAAHHLAACMLLASFEILLPSESSDEWPWHICGALDIIQATRLEEHRHQRDIGCLLDWFYFHQTICRFPMHHWQNEKRLDLPVAAQTALARHRPSPPSPNPTHAILNLLSEALEAQPRAWDRQGRSEEYHTHLKSLERRVEGLTITPTSAGSPTDTALAVEVYQIATRIYLIRATQRAWEPTSSADLDTLVNRAFEIPFVSSCCTHFFPIFIVACEARTDEQRATIMSLIGRADVRLKPRNMEWLRRVIQSVWVQMDLHMDGDLLVDYLGMISAVISSSNALPSFA
ncbi:fungal-specific transcription factor domain-containing protein [Coniochaeta sp. 2T2.1]|nr:fungal-specific transcription factor domain-containing protein [Coniochaeta sp. 2T2.1]